MSKGVFISINPKWCELIASGDKTIEVRKTRPKLETPFKCYIYCTQPKYPHEDFITIGAGTENARAFYGGGKVIGEFVCDHIYQYTTSDGNRDGTDISDIDMERMSCLNFNELRNYECGSNPDEGMGLVGLYGWHISDLVIYDTPRELSEFRKSNFACPRENCEGCYECVLSRPPQSWCYVEEIA